VLRISMLMLLALAAFSQRCRRIAKACVSRLATTLFLIAVVAGGA